MQQGDSQYRRLVDSFHPIFGAAIFFGTDRQRIPAAVVHQVRFNFMTEARIWDSRDPEQRLLPGDCQNVIVLSDEFYREISGHPNPNGFASCKKRSRRAPRRWTCSRGSRAAALRRADGSEFRCLASSGLLRQLGSADYVRPRRVREKLEGWLQLVRAVWPECPARIDEDDLGLWVDQAAAVRPRA